MLNVVSMQQAAKMINNGDVLGFNAFGSLQFPDELAKAIGDRFLEEGAPRDMGMICVAGQGAWVPDCLIENMSYEGMIKRVIASHFTPMINIKQQVIENKIEAYNFTAGAVVQMYRAGAGNKPCVITKTGLKSFQDPRYGRIGQNDISNDELITVTEIYGEEYLMYKVEKPTVALIRGTTADCKGNITMEKEGFIGDPFALAMSTKSNGGKVIVQVERVSSQNADPKLVKIPGTIVDAIVVAPNQKQSLIEEYNPTYNGELRLLEEDVPAMAKHIDELNMAFGRKRLRGVEHQIIARRAALELTPNAIVNLGIGVPEMVPAAAKDMEISNDITLTVEAGCIGGTPSSGISFGASINVDVLFEMGFQFDYYEGGGLDIAFLGAMQVDKKGNVNVSRTERNLIGIGGFISISQSANKIVYCFPFSGGGMEFTLKDGKMQIQKEGKYTKFYEEVYEISSSGELANELGKEVLYITERCVFRLTKQGLVITEIAPGLDIEKDIKSKIPFDIKVADDLKIMDEILFKGLEQ